MPTALITGITGQDGSYLADLLLEKGYRVVGMVRRASVSRLDRIEHIKDQIEIVEADLLDICSLVRAIERVKPDEIYNLAAMSFVPASWEQPILTAEFTGVSVLKMLEAIRMVNRQIKFFQASSSEMFGHAREIPQNESTPFYPRSPYGVAKVFGYWATVNYRESYGMFATSGIMFNHESPRRGLEFVTRKITNAAAKIKVGLQDYLYLGNLEAKRDWGFAGDYVKAMWMMMQNSEPRDYVISTGKSHSVREFCELAFSLVGLDYQKYVKIDQKLFRPAEVDFLVGDSSKILRELGWKPQVSFEELVKMMIESDLELAKKELERKKKGL